jgi:hypothetical protein
MIVGRTELITDDYIQICFTDNNQKELHARIYMVGSDTFKLNVRENLEIGGVVGVKGHLGLIEDDKGLKLIGDKFTFLGKSGSISDTRGDETEDA